MQQAQLTWTKGLLRDDKGDVQVIDIESGWAFFSLFHQQHRDLVCQLIKRCFNSVLLHATGYKCLGLKEYFVHYMEVHFFPLQIYKVIQ